MRFRYNVKYESFGGRAIGRMVQMQNESKSRKTEKYFDLYWYIGLYTGLLIKQLESSKREAEQ